MAEASGKNVAVMCEESSVDEGKKKKKSRSKQGRHKKMRARVEVRETWLAEKKWKKKK